jgi:diadenosine tetraphosphate (Ap4A) HIT family hydrolase
MKDLWWIQVSNLPEPKDKEIIYEDEKLYACLARHPKTEGHVVVVWKDKLQDLNLLSRKDYEYLMDSVDELRNAMIETLDVEKVYLIYMDEAKHVHWHLVPRYNEKGYNILENSPGKIEDFQLAGEIKANLEINI